MTMKYETTPAPKFSQIDLDAAITTAQKAHNPTVFLECWSFAEALTTIEQYKAEKYTLDPTFVPVSLPLASGLAVFHARMLKPKKLVDQELQYIATEATEAYHAALKAAQVDAVERMAVRLLGEALEAEQRKQNEVNQQAEDAARAEAAAILGVVLE